MGKLQQLGFAVKLDHERCGIGGWAGASWSTETQQVRLDVIVSFSDITKSARMSMAGALYAQQQTQLSDSCGNCCMVLRKSPTAIHSELHVWMVLVPWLKHRRLHATP